MKRILLGAAGLLAAAVTVAYAAGNFPDYPQVGQPSFCTSNVTGVNAAGNTSVVCAQTVPAGPPAVTGNELIPADTGLNTPATVTIPSGMFAAGPSNANALVGADFGQSLWQRGTTPINAGTPASATYGPDGWYVFTQGAQGGAETITVSKQTGATDVFPGTLASARIQRVNAQTLVAPIQFGQLVPDDISGRFPGNTAIFSCFMLAGANYSPAGSTITMVIAYHSAADVTTPGANGQGTNTATFATSIGATQNITNYTEAVVTSVPITTTWTRYSVAAPIPLTIPNTATTVTGVGVKLIVTPVGTAGAADWVEVANCQLESRLGTSVGPSPFIRRNLTDEYALENARYWAVLENGAAGTPIYATGQATTTNVFNVMFNMPTQMRITPVASPITAGGFKVNAAGTLQTVSQLSTTGLQQTARTGALGGVATITAGQGTTFVGSGAGTGVLGFSAEP
jgi:hypothetical protein